jgi:hypothetical protein
VASKGAGGEAGFESIDKLPINSGDSGINVDIVHRRWKSMFVCLRFISKNRN